MRAACVCACLLIFGCRDDKLAIKPAPERELPRTPAPSPTPSGSVVTSLTGRAGDEVTVAGIIEPRPKPHIKWSITGKSPMVIDLAESHHKVVAHVDSAPSCPGEIFLTGKVFVAVGLIRQGTTEGEYAEPQLDVTKWRCR